MYPMSDSVELAAAYLNPSPQVKAHANRLQGLLTRPVKNPDPAPAPQSAVTAWALNRRLSDEVRSAIVTAYREGVRKQVLADRHGISLSSIKRLLRASRSTT
jgi:DNA-directed RNA polymerase specialized sigma24 family protein